MMETLYTAEVTARGGREGAVRSSDGVLSLKLVTPKGLGGPGGDLTNPEQLFAAGYAACFENAILHVGRARKVRVGATSVTARVSIGPISEGRFGLAVELDVRLPDLDHAAAEEIVAAADLVCPYSNAVRGNVVVLITVDPSREAL